ncbi:hypothetical protein FB381_3599 [Nocardioides albertanoniae]|uniref:LPXTG-motif cell wall-anchored protein n=1 Tax=Nocardioides albertanoniae TaxID=1175486 RepID=A0A543AB47_9ACTN|nr:hypothetical protein FB381_3599 [Nocardioides albertanoniae]
MISRACVALILLLGAVAIGLSPSAAQAAEPRPEWAAVSETSSTDRNPPAAPDQGQPADTSRQSSVPDTGGPSWAFAAVGAALMVAGTVVTAKARRGDRKHG